MIIDRTNEDVIKATQILKEKIQQFVELTDEEKKTIDRGLIGIDTINRIEAKQAEISKRLSDMGYPADTSNKTWNRGEFFKEADFVRIITNHNKMRDSFIVDGKLVVPFYNIVNINELERYLVEAESMADDIESRYRECGAYECGGG